MSLRSLPILFLNLGGEMVYIIDQRLRAQKIPEDKARKVLNDIVGTMFNRRFIEELFKPQEIYSKKALRTVFDKLAHASIMRLNTASMDKLYDLMTMAVKHQVYMCPQPSDILLVTLNHLDSIRAFVSGVNVQEQVCNVYALFSDCYSRMTQGDLQLIRVSLLNFFQDYHVRVSIFLRTNVQNPNGRFVMPVLGALSSTSEIPGIIRYYDNDGDISSTNYFQPCIEYTDVPQAGSLDFIGNRVVTFGTNMYLGTKTTEDVTKTETVKAPASPTSNDFPEDQLGLPADDDNSAREELALLAGLISHVPATSSHEFRLNLFTDDTEEEIATQTKPVIVTRNIVNIDASQTQNSESLAKVMKEMLLQEASSSSTQNSGDGSDLLDLMDLAAFTK